MCHWWVGYSSWILFKSIIIWFWYLFFQSKVKVVSMLYVYKKKSVQLMTYRDVIWCQISAQEKSDKWWAMLAWLEQDCPAGIILSHCKCWACPSFCCWSRSAVKWSCRKLALGWVLQIWQLEIALLNLCYHLFLEIVFMVIYFIAKEIYN